MVSNASEDFPEPERPVNTTSLSRGISTSMFLRLCSRAPRIVIARIAEAFCWRFALNTSSISAFPGAQTALRIQAHIAGNSAADANGVTLEHSKNGKLFPVLAANHQRLFFCSVAMAADGSGQTKRPARGRPFVIRLNAADISTSRRQGRPSDSLRGP